MPCKIMKPVVNVLKEENFEINYVDVDENQDLALKYGIMSIPTFVLMDGENEVKRHVGIMDIHKFREFLNNV